MFIKIPYLLKHHRRRLYLLLGSILFALFIAEGIIRVGSFDWRLIQRMLMYQRADLTSYEAVADPEFVYRLKPGGSVYDLHSVYVNAFRYRDPERTKSKPPGVFRIIATGGSNVYGLGLNNHETWPARLETELNQTQPGCMEWWWLCLHSKTNDRCVQGSHGEI